MSRFEFIRTFWLPEWTRWFTWLEKQAHGAAQFLAKSLSVAPNPKDPELIGHIVLAHAQNLKAIKWDWNAI